MRRTLCALVAILCAAPAWAQDDDLYVVDVTSLGAWVQLRFVTTDTLDEICPLEPVDLFLSATTFDADGFVTDGVIDFTTDVPPEAECLDAAGPWSGLLVVQVGGAVPQIWPGLYEVVIDDSFEGELWVEPGYVEFTADEAFADEGDVTVAPRARPIASPAVYPPPGVAVPPQAVRPSFVRLPVAEGEEDELADDLEALEDDRAELEDDLLELEDDNLEILDDWTDEDATDLDE